MKRIVIIYWVIIILFFFLMFMLVFMYFISEEVKVNFIKMGFNDVFCVELVVVKIIGVIVLLVLFKF